MLVKPWDSMINAVGAAHHWLMLKQLVASCKCLAHCASVCVMYPQSYQCFFMECVGNCAISACFAVRRCLYRKHSQVYFRLNTLTNCKNVIKTIEGPLQMFDTAAKAQQVTYRCVCFSQVGFLFGIHCAQADGCCATALASSCGYLMESRVLVTPLPS
jgi:hypothetical protein